MRAERGDAIGLARDNVRTEFVERAMLVDLNIHWKPDNPHAHVMLTMRETTPDGFGRKVREWEPVELLREWRQHWASGRWSSITNTTPFTSPIRASRPRMKLIRL